MKKFLCYGFLVLGLIFFTGCGRKSLNCSRNNDYSDDMKMQQDLKIKFSNNHVSKLSMHMIVELGGEYVDYKNSLLESVESEFSDISSEKGVKYSSSSKDSGFDFKLNINFNRVSDDAKKRISIVDYENSYDSVKHDLEDSGYVCE